MHITNPTLTGMSNEILDHIAHQVILEAIQRAYDSVDPMTGGEPTLDTVFEDFCHLIKPFNANRTLRAVGTSAFFAVMGLHINFFATRQAPSLFVGPRELATMTIPFAPYFNRIHRISITIDQVGIRHSIESGLSSFSANPPALPPHVRQISLLLECLPKAAQVHLPKVVRILRKMGASQTDLCVGSYNPVNNRQRNMKTESDDHVAETLANANGPVVLLI